MILTPLGADQLCYPCAKDQKLSHEHFGKCDLCGEMDTVGFVNDLAINVIFKKQETT